MTRDTKSIAVCNYKGGVGKTTCTVNLACCFAKMGFKVLVIDADPQGNASSTLFNLSPIDYLEDVMTLGQSLLGGADGGLMIYPTAYEGIWIAPTGGTDFGRDNQIRARMGNDDLLRRVYQDVEHEYDITLLDCPANPSSSVYARNALMFADYVLIPITTGQFVIDSLDITLKYIEEELQGVGTQSLGCAVVSYDRRAKRVNRQFEDVLEASGEYIFQTRIPLDVAFFYAERAHKVAVEYVHSKEHYKLRRRHGSKGPDKYVELAREVQGRIAELETPRQTTAPYTVRPTITRGYQRGT